MLPQWLIEKKRDGLAHSADELRAWIAGYVRGEIPDYQMAAWAMAVYFRGLTFEETAALTEAMLRSGAVVDTSALPWPTADKHSTGGIGDKISLVLAPLVACCEVAVPMISGRGLGITGGTLDKLEAIPGYRTRLSRERFLEILADCGCSIMGATEDLAPADRKLYALRDVTGTVPSIPLIAASILSKKLAEGASALVLDVKWGRGAFMKTVPQARELARTMVEIGRRMGRRMTALITDMNQPLGRTAGNALEIAETLAVLRGEGPDDVRELTLELGAQMLWLAGRAARPDEARAPLERALRSGAAFERFCRMVRLHGGDEAALRDPARLPQARLRRDWPAPRAGRVAAADAERIGRACLALGAGRARVEDAVDPAVGCSGIAKIGDAVERGQPLLTLHANDAARLDEAQRLLEGAFSIQETAAPPPLIVETIRA